MPRAWPDVHQAPALPAALLVGAAVAASWALEWLSGGAGTVPPHLFYLPILLAGARFGAPGALLTALTSTLVAGPLLLDDVAGHQAQNTADWTTRGVFFVGIGLCATWLFRRYRTAFDRERALLNAERDAALSAMAELRAAEARAADRERALQEQTARQEFEARLRDAFQMAQDEHAALEVVRRAVFEAGPSHPAVLLLADSSEAHLRAAVVQLGPDGLGPDCRVGTPWRCPAMRTGRPQVFTSSGALDACPLLLPHDGEQRSAVCLPVSFLGRGLGVLHTTGPDGQRPAADRLERLAAVAGQSGTALGTLRAFARSQLQASTDGLTGLLNRRALDEQLSALHQLGRSYSVLMGDLDHFKLLNDSYGHATGDRALHLFARLLRDSARSSDLVARYGGEEFVVVQPDGDLETAVRTAERLRAALADATLAAQLPPFTASFGVAARPESATWEAAIAAADTALFAAKRAGRDRVHVAEADQPLHLVEPDRGSGPAAHLGAGRPNR